MSFNWLTLSTASQAQLFPWMISKSANALFRFLTTSGWLLPETTLHFFSCTGKTRSSFVNFSPFQRHHYRYFKDTPCTFACQFSRNYPRHFFRGGAFLVSGYAYLFALRIAVSYSIVFRSWDMVCINLSFASREFVCARSTASAQPPRFALHSTFCPIGVDSTLSVSRVVYR